MPFGLHRIGTVRGDPTQAVGKEAMKEPDRRALTAALPRSLRTEFSDTYTPNTHKAYDRAEEALRVGAAQSLVAVGASTVELMQAGRWTDAATATRYGANELAGRGAVARYFKDEERE